MLIPMVLQLRTTLSRISSLVEGINKNLPNILNDVNQITNQVARAGTQIQNAVDDIVDIERRISNQLKRPVVEMASSLGALLKIIQTILALFSKKR
jgi:ABC-type transporter Mla subunit MlaD